MTIANDENKGRGGICMYCGFAFVSKSLEPEDIAIVYDELIAHDKQCPKSPLVKRIAELEAEKNRLREVLERITRHCEENNNGSVACEWARKALLEI
jgi:hypothetical protein